MRRNLITGWAVAAAAALLSCGGGTRAAPEPATPPPEVVAEPPPPPEPPGPSKAELGQQIADRYLECQRAINAQETATLAGCYTDDVEVTTSDSPAKLTGPQQAAESYKGLYQGFPDFAFRSPLVLASGDHLAVLLHAYGMNLGPFMNRRPTRRTIGLYGMTVSDWRDGKMARVVNVYDPVTLMAQLGMIPVPARKAAAPPQGEPTIVVATDSQEESENVATVKALCDAINKHDAAAVTALVADDTVWSDAASPADTEGKAAVEAMLGGLFTAFPDVAVACDPWAAGAYVVNMSAWTGTNTGPWKEAGLAKPTGKQVSLHDGEIYELAGGKVKRCWWFSNGLAFATQLGLMDPNQPPKAHKKKRR